MNVTKPERPFFSDLTERQWKNIVDAIEYAWDLGTGCETINGHMWDLQRDIVALVAFSLICPGEEKILRDYNASCREAYIREMILKYKRDDIDMPASVEVSK